MLGKDEVDIVRKRVNEIIRNYAYGKDESYLYITLYFETSDGRSQYKRLQIGKPSSKTRDCCRDLPHGYLKGTPDFDGLCPISVNDLLFPEIVWKTCDGEVWDGTPLAEIRKRKQKGE